MQQHNFDGVILQRFILGVTVLPGYLGFIDQVARNVRAGAAAYGRVLAVMSSVAESSTRCRVQHHGDAPRTGNGQVVKRADLRPLWLPSRMPYSESSTSESKNFTKSPRCSPELNAIAARGCSLSMPVIM